MVGLIAGNNWGNDVGVEGFPKGPDVDNNSRFNMVGPGYFATVGIPVLAGREFTRSDALGAPKVAVVNQAFARKFKLGANPVGRRMDQGNDSLDIEIVGLVQDAKYSDVKDEIPPHLLHAVHAGQHGRRAVLLRQEPGRPDGDAPGHGARGAGARREPAGRGICGRCRSRSRTTSSSTAS